MKLLVDADACPVVELAVFEARERNIECILLCDTSHVLEREGEKTVVVFVNNINHTGHRDTTWLYDIAFERLVGKVDAIVGTGPRAYDLAVRPIDPPVKRTISLAFRNMETLPTAARHFIDLVVKKHCESEKGRAQWNELFR